MNELFEPIVGTVPKKRKVTLCSKCINTGHNAARCPNIVSNIGHEQTKNIKLGQYIIGCNPVDEFGVSNNILLGNDTIQPRQQQMQPMIFI
jgi:hypothetical protein